MDPPHFLLGALNDSIISSDLINTKFYDLSRRECSGRVGSPRALHCNSRILNTIPSFSNREWLRFRDVGRWAVYHLEAFSDAFPEGQLKDIIKGFPSNSHPSTERYDYPFDSDLEDESSNEEYEGDDRDLRIPRTHKRPKVPSPIIRRNAHR